MLNTACTISATARIIAKHEVIWAKTARLVSVYRQFARLSTLAPIALGAILCAAASTVQAQAYPLAQTSTSTPWDRLSFAPTKSEAASRFVLNVPDAAKLGLYNSSSEAFTGANGRAERIRTAILNPGRFWLTPATQSADYGFLPSDSFPRASYLSLLEVRYHIWESNIAETRTLTDVNGALVYPLVQIDYTTGHFPIALSIAPLRGSSDIR